MIVYLSKKKAFIFVAILIFLFLSMGTFFVVSTVSAKPVNSICVVIDPGHGGIDGGCVGKTTGVCESDLNLIYAKNLAEQLKGMGISSCLTRKDKNGLYDKNASNLKKSDMLKRKEIIESVNPTLVISIHMNSFSSSSACGAQVFYKKDNESGKIFANCVQIQLNKCIKNAKKTAKIGDYYMVNCTSLPAVLVECGYLSNKNEEILLQKKDYQNKFCYVLCCGIIDFLNENKP